MARPLALDQPARTRPNGQVVTIGEAITEAVGLGQDFTAAAKGAGISMQTLHNWRVTAARARTERIKGRKITANDDRLIGFLDALERAESNAELERLAIIHRASQPYQVVKVVEKVNAEGVLIERTTSTETRPGRYEPAAWWLERRLAHKYARRVEVSGPDGGDIPVGDRARDLADSLADYLQGAADAAEAAAASKP